jgi:hypothetical protein
MLEWMPNWFQEPIEAAGLGKQASTDDEEVEPVPKVYPEGVSTVAGVVGSSGHADGEGSAAKFKSPQNVCACADGSVWVADTYNQCIRRIAADGTVSTVAGVVGSEGHADGEGSVAKFKSPMGVCACADGSVWVADQGNQCIRRIAADGTLSKYASEEA